MQLDNTVVRAPFGGVVVAKSAQPGEMISPISAGGGFTRTGIGTIVDMDSLEIQVDVNESFINRVAAGQPVEATLNAYPDWKIPGVGDRDHPDRRPQQGHGEGAHRASSRRTARIVPDMGVRVAFLPQPPPAPGTAARAGRARAGRGGARGGRQGRRVRLRRGQGGAARVTLGQTVGGERQVLSGLRAGERVVLAPPEALKDGDAVKLAEGGRPARRIRASALPP